MKLTTKQIEDITESAEVTVQLIFSLEKSFKLTNLALAVLLKNQSILFSVMLNNEKE